jgi:hypothetical protein
MNQRPPPPTSFVLPGNAEQSAGQPVPHAALSVTESVTGSANAATLRAIRRLCIRQHVVGPIDAPAWSRPATSQRATSKSRAATIPIDADGPRLSPRWFLLTGAAQPPCAPTSAGAPRRQAKTLSCPYSIGLRENSRPEFSVSGWCCRCRHARWRAATERRLIML